MTKVAVLGLLAALQTLHALEDQCAGDASPCDTRSSSLLQKGWDVAAAAQPQEDPLEDAGEVGGAGADDGGLSEDAGEVGEAGTEDGGPGEAQPPRGEEADSEGPAGPAEERAPEEAGPGEESSELEAGADPALLAGGGKPTFGDAYKVVDAMRWQLGQLFPRLEELATDTLNGLGGVKTEKDLARVWESGGRFEAQVKQMLRRAKAAIAAMQKYQAYFYAYLKAPVTYNCLTRELWTDAKKAWCCKEKGLGCPKVTYNCLTRELWTDAKKAWCCKEKGLGCPKDDYNCFTRELWTEAKTAWCCEAMGLGCPEPEVTHNCYTKEIWTDAKTAWCCKEKGLGCPKAKLTELGADVDPAALLAGGRKPTLKDALEVVADMRNKAATWSLNLQELAMAAAKEVKSESDLKDVWESPSRRGYLESKVIIALGRAKPAVKAMEKYHAYYRAYLEASHPKKK